MKVTDRRMFTDDGELREEYRFLERKKTFEQQKTRAAGERPPSSSEAGAASAGAAPAGGAARAAASTSFPGVEAEATPRMPPRGAQSPGFMDLVAALAEPVAFLLGDVELPDGRSGRDLPRARRQIDLLAVLREKTRGAVSEQESALLEELLAQFRMRYVEKSRG